MRYILIILLLSACRKDIVKQLEAEPVKASPPLQLIVGESYTEGHSRNHNWHRPFGVIIGEGEWEGHPGRHGPHGKISTDEDLSQLSYRLRWHSTGIGGEAAQARFTGDDLEMLSLSARNDLRKLYWHALIFSETRAGQTPEQLRTLWWEELGLSKPVNN